MNKIYNADDFDGYIASLKEGTYLVRLRFWYDFEDIKDATTGNVILVVEENLSIWDYDWWEGQQNIELVWIAPLEDIVGVQIRMIDDTI